MTRNKKQLMQTQSNNILRVYLMDNLLKESSTNSMELQEYTIQYSTDFMITCILEINDYILKNVKRIQKINGNLTINDVQIQNTLCMKKAHIKIHISLKQNT